MHPEETSSQLVRLQPLLHVIRNAYLRTPARALRRLSPLASIHAGGPAVHRTHWACAEYRNLYSSTLVRGSARKRRSKSWQWGVSVQALVARLDSGPSPIWPAASEGGASPLDEPAGWQPLCAKPVEAPAPDLVLSWPGNSRARQGFTVEVCGSSHTNCQKKIGTIMPWRSNADLILLWNL